ncbi:MAG: cysS [Parcubacteria group bacterium]|nr:cysS [Parcubacteria group bacterium]
MAIRLYNTLGLELQTFQPLEKGKVSMYHCGPTVYDYVHIGNLRSFYMADLLRRMFEFEGYEVKQVMNITDVGIGGDNDEGEDRIIRGLKREGKEVTLENMKELTEFYTEKFIGDTVKMNFLSPHVLPRASQHIEDDIRLIQELESKGFAYTTSNAVYFDTSRTPNYGKLGGIVQGDGASRIGTNEEKRNQKDFALWKFNTSLGYPSPWGQGFPGWHIECSVMSTKYLGQPFDIHTGGVDLAPIHHNNEIAQSEAACGCAYANYWMHNEFVNVGEAKMAKSEGNFITMRSIEEKGFSPLAYRYFLLTAHYRTPTNFSWEALESAENAYKRLKTLMQMFKKESDGKEGSVNKAYKQEFLEAIENDCNTPEALAVVWKLGKSAGDGLSYPDAHATLLDFDRVLGLKLSENEYEVTHVSRAVNDLLRDREAARMAKNFSKADEIRVRIEALGYNLKDTENGQELEKI